MKLIGVEKSGALIHKTWLHTDGAGDDVFTTETIQDVAPVIASVKNDVLRGKGKDFRLKAKIPLNLINETCYKTAVLWGVQPADVMAELMNSKTDRSKKVWKLLTEGRDFSKLQARSY